MTYETGPLSPLVARVRRHVMLLLLLAIIFGTGVALGLHLIELKEVAQTALGGAIGLLFQVRAVRP